MVDVEDQDAFKKMTNILPSALDTVWGLIIHDLEKLLYMRKGKRSTILPKDKFVSAVCDEARRDLAAQRSQFSKRWQCLKVWVPSILKL